MPHQTETIEQLAHELTSELGASATVSTGSSIITRWSTYKRPVPGIVVNASSEADVATTVRICNSKNVPFLAQGGGNGWSSSMGFENGALINLAGLNDFVLSADRNEATIGGGVTVKQTIEAAFANGVQVLTGNCNGVGTVGAYLGGGYGNLMGIHGFGVDNVKAIRVVTADGKLQTVTAKSDPDLFWALRGAGPNLGIVTSITVKAFPVTSEQQMAWTAVVGFTPDKIEQLAQAIQDLKLTSQSVIFMYFASSGDPQNTPIVLATMFLYNGDSDQGHEFFKSIYDIGPVFDMNSVKPYNEWNGGADPFCVHGSRKPSYGIGLKSIVPSTWRALWDDFVKFQQLAGAFRSAILLETYDLTKATSIPSDSAAYPYRDLEYNAIVIAWYDDEALDERAEEFGKRARALLRETDGFESPRTYINFAHGDEPNEEVYGPSLPRLQAIKKRVDPDNKFGSWFPIQ